MYYMYEYVNYIQYIVHICKLVMYYSVRESSEEIMLIYWKYSTKIAWELIDDLQYPYMI